MQATLQKIIHVDMDCFYAAIEIRDNPSLAGKPVAVGGLSPRSVLCTCNYEARKYGVHSAMPTTKAYRLCPDLIVLPVEMAKYKAASQRIQQIFHEFTDLVEPLSLDEAYLDVTDSPHFNGSATLIAKAIQARIFAVENLTASAGVAPNKFLAKIASAWQKPNGLFVIRPHEIAEFIKVLPVEKLHGVGRVTAQKLHALGFKTCADLQTQSLIKLTNRFGKLGQTLYEQCHGVDHRIVNPHRERKSVSVENTFNYDLKNPAEHEQAIIELHQKLAYRLQTINEVRPIKNQFVKIKFNDFTTVSAETKSGESNLDSYQKLFLEAYTKIRKPIRLLGLGVSFSKALLTNDFQQQELFVN